MSVKWSGRLYVIRTNLEMGLGVLILGKRLLNKVHHTSPNSLFSKFSK